MITISKFKILVCSFVLATAFSSISFGDCFLRTFYIGLEKPVLTEEIPIDDVIAQDGSLHKFTWIYPENALKEDVTHSKPWGDYEIVNDLIVSFKKHPINEIDVHFDMAATYNRRSVLASRATEDQIQVNHSLKNITMATRVPWEPTRPAKSYSGVIAGDTMAVDVFCIQMPSTK